MLLDKQDKLSAGDFISIDNNVISTYGLATEDSVASIDELLSLTRQDLSRVTTAMTYHINNNDVHVSAAQREAWDAKPNVWCGSQYLYDHLESIDENTIYLIKAADCLYTEAIDDGTFQWSQPIGAVNTVEVSYDNGLSWQELAAETPTPTISAGKKVLWKATHEGIGTTSGLLHLSSSSQFNVGGNVLSVVYGDAFEGTLRLDNGYELAFLFAGTQGVDASALVMPTFLAPYSCANMFYNCTSLTTAPQLPAPTVAQNAYRGMFQGCTNLSSITCYARILGLDATANWVSGVASSGTFTKAASMRDWTTGVSGIPEGWEVVDV